MSYMFYMNKCIYRMAMNLLRSTRSTGLYWHRILERRSASSFKRFTLRETLWQSLCSTRIENLETLVHLLTLYICRAVGFITTTLRDFIQSLSRAGKDRVRAQNTSKNDTHPQTKNALSIYSLNSFLISWYTDNAPFLSEGWAKQVKWERETNTVSKNAMHGVIAQNTTETVHIV